MRHKKSGLSLVELLVVCTLSVLFLMLAVSGNERGYREGAEARSAAETFAEALRAARQQARSQGEAIAVGLPGSSSFCGSGFLSDARGPRPFVFRSTVNLSGDFPGSYLCWGVHGSEAVADILTSGDYSLATLEGLPSDDPLIVFLPDGTHLVRGLASRGDRHLVRVGQSPSGSGFGGGASLNGLNRAWEVSLAQNRGDRVPHSTNFPGGRRFSGGKCYARCGGSCSSLASGG